jgi:putative Holliday junction resolvase
LKRWVAVDYGARRIGLAAADLAGTMAFPSGTLPGSGSAHDDAANVVRWAVEQDAGGIVVGLPLNMDGSDSAQTRTVRHFAAVLRGTTALPVELCDERLSSFQADQVLEAAQVRPGKRKALRDALAAQVILQAFLDARRGPQTDAGTRTGDTSSE